MIKVFVAVAFAFLCTSLNAQDNPDSLRIITPAGQDTALIEAYAARYNPAKASLYAAVLPGLGQIYNKKYWKLPLVYGGFYAIGYGLNFYQGLYKDYKAELYYILETGNDRSQQNHTEAQLRPAIDNVRRQRDFMIILMGGMYILQIIDAHVDAHLKEFDVNPNLQVKIRPSYDNDVMIGRQMGVSLTITF